MGCLNADISVLNLIRAAISSQWSADKRGVVGEIRDVEDEPSCSAVLCMSCEGVRSQTNESCLAVHCVVFPYHTRSLPYHTIKQHVLMFKVGQIKQNVY